ncbi:MAG TPA: pyridoxal-phosphate dependent enzyme, partial [Acidimicrobiia bacterium]|nr:pyridoxal-phosphate dependent enzyme [Acidimicrobiia bacterium]
MSARPSRLRPPSLADVEAAAIRIAPYVHRTPVLTCRSIDDVVGTRVHMKAEHLQRTGSFKMRGATNAVFALAADLATRAVAAHSSGNHAAALACAARTRGIPCHVVMPENTPAAKVDATRAYGARVDFCAPTLEAREAALRVVIEQTGALEIHPYDHPDVVAGQATAALELLHDRPQIEAVIAPVSGGGLLS